MRTRLGRRDLVIIQGADACALNAHLAPKTVSITTGQAVRPARSSAGLATLATRPLPPAFPAHRLGRSSAGQGRAVRLRGVPVQRDGRWERVEGGILADTNGSAPCSRGPPQASGVCVSDEGPWCQALEVNPSLPWNHREPLCGPPFSQVTPDRRGRSYRFSLSAVMRSLDPLRPK
jgi:hypothetical protein